MDLDPPQLSKEVEERLNVLQGIADSLYIDDPSDPLSYQSAIAHLSADALAAKRLLNRLAFIEQELQTHLATTRFEVRLLAQGTEALDAEHAKGENAAVLERRREDLVRKAKEYHEELKSILKTMPDAPAVTVSCLTEQQARNRAREQELKAKRAKVKAFKGLPPNIELARHELRNARNELGELTQLRERLLGRMAEGVS
ncbi:hypothetical protein H0H81_002723 [Sphagnurus paluster]|uniref:Uncharacterized protein n=1 Tax=Sphagnurus paluster TaxID=117069 RepID=A0A9P7GGL3_9AGAR|nr:hypothetical protein H0H81_002723 [Sphagnurus paluster]